MINMVVCESPYKGNDNLEFVNNIHYAKECLRDSINRGEAPFMSHLLYTQVLLDKVPEQREKGISLNLEMIKRANLLAVYTDLGVSEGMNTAVKYALEKKIPIEFRSIIK